MVFPVSNALVERKFCVMTRVKNDFPQQVRARYPGTLDEIIPKRQVIVIIMLRWMLLGSLQINKDVLVFSHMGLKINSFMINEI